MVVQKHRDTNHETRTYVVVVVVVVVNVVFDGRLTSHTKRRKLKKFGNCAKLCALLVCSYDLLLWQCEIYFLERIQ